MADMTFRGSKVATISGGPTPDSVAVPYGNKEIYICITGSGTIEAFDAVENSQQPPAPPPKPKKAAKKNNETVEGDNA